MLYLAPLQGYTNYIFRNVYSRFFDGIDIAVSPFVSLVDGKRIKLTHLKDVLPENNSGMMVIPQILGYRPEQFIIMANDLYKLGYESINWNLGCPVPAIARKKRGSGMLSHPKLIEETLNEVLPNIPNKLSIKTRLGYLNNKELLNVIPVLNDFPLEFLNIHPRIGKQMYEGELDLETFSTCIKVSKHKIIFSGDIIDYDFYNKIKNQFPSINDWMLGRGLLSNLFLPNEILQKEDYSKEIKLEIFSNFINELFEEIKKTMTADVHLLNKMKEYWVYFKRMFVDGDEIFNTLKYIQDIEKFHKTTNEILKSAVLNIPFKYYK
ncbi:MAG: tRNA-dihydrouridine synthase family protein [Bacteroidales bacterium]|nr:tRNA-dihydrouridine synthase family protein [Bacteroidales bacterium]